jgi:hypothetical protein
MSITEIATNFTEGPVSNFFNEKKKDIMRIFHDKNDAYKSFHNNLFMLKGVFVIVFIIASIYYSLTFKDNNLMDGSKENTSKITIETIIVAISVFIPYTLLYFLRNKTGDNLKKGFLKHSVLLIIFITGVHLLFEYSGFYSLAYEKDSPEVEKAKSEEKAKPNVPLSSTDKFFKALGFSGMALFMIIMIVGLIIMFVALLFIRDTNLNYNHKLFGSSIFTFVLETLVVGIVSACPVYLISYNRGKIPDDRTTIEFIILALKFAGVHIGLQLGGFYSHVFNDHFKY